MRRILAGFAAKLLSFVGRGIEGGVALAAGGKAEQLSLALHYKTLVARGFPLPALQDVGFRAYSQADEDGVLLFLFSVIGTTNRVFVEIGAGNGMECNCANLAINFGWHGLFVDGDSGNVALGRSFYRRHPDTRLFPPEFVEAMVTRDNVDGVVGSAGFRGEIDLLSIDIDGMEYWIWDAIEAVSPRVVVVEANAKLGLRSITVPYDPKWVYRPRTHPHYHGASLPALTRLAAKKGYRLVGTNRFGFNSFYIRNRLAEELLPAVTVESCRRHPTRRRDAELFERIGHMPFVEV